MEIEKPKIDISNILGITLLFLGFLVFLIIIHIEAINATGNTQSVLNTTFSVFIYIFSFSLILAVVALLIHLMTIIGWYTTTPNWKKKRAR